MASICTRILQRSSIRAFKSSISKSTSSSLTRSPTPSFASPSNSSKSIHLPLTRFSLSRSRPELGSVASMLPLHSAVADSRMTSCLTLSSRSCRACYQGRIPCAKVLSWSGDNIVNTQFILTLAVCSSGPLISLFIGFPSCSEMNWTELKEREKFFQRDGPISSKVTGLAGGVTEAANDSFCCQSNWIASTSCDWKKPCLLSNCFRF